MPHASSSGAYWRKALTCLGESCNVVSSPFSYLTHEWENVMYPYVCSSSRFFFSVHFLYFWVLSSFALQQLMCLWCFPKHHKPQGGEEPFSSISVWIPARIDSFPCKFSWEKQKLSWVPSPSQIDQWCYYSQAIKLPSWQKGGILHTSCPKQWHSGWRWEQSSARCLNAWCNPHLLLLVSSAFLLPLGLVLRWIMLRSWASSRI